MAQRPPSLCPWCNGSSTTQWIASLVCTQNLVLLLAIEHFFIKADKTNAMHNEI